MANITGKTNAELLDMDIDEIIAIATDIGKLDELARIAAEKVEHKHYPRITVYDEKKGKNVSVADKTKAPVFVMEAPTFFEIKAKFIHDICGVPRKQKAKQPTFRDRIAAAAANGNKNDAIGEKLGFKKK